MQIVRFLFAQKSCLFFIMLLFFHCNFSNNFTLTLCFPLFWQFSFLIINLGSRSRQRRWLTRFYHFASFQNLLHYWHFTNKTHIFFLIFVVSVCNLKSYLTFHTIIIHPIEIFWKEQSVNVLINLCICSEVFLESREMFVVFNNKIINNSRCIFAFQWQFV